MEILYAFIKCHGILHKVIDCTPDSIDAHSAFGMYNPFLHEDDAACVELL